MFGSILGRLTNSNQHKLSEIQPIVNKINSLAKETSKLSDDEIKAKTKGWQKELRSPDLSKEDVVKRLDEILPEAFALVREAAKRTVNQSHRDVQLIAGIVLHHGKIAEQKTGEGKTLTATLPLYLNSLPGTGVHLVTPNDYLSKHGAGWYGSVYEALGLTVGVIVDNAAFKFDPEYKNPNVIDEYSSHLRPVDRVDAYKCDVTYGTNSQFGFDYLRDNMAVSADRIVQMNPIGKVDVHAFAIVDEVDFVLIDIARTPLIISSAREEKSDKYYRFSGITRELIQDTDYTIDEKERVVTLTELGINKVERKLGVQNLYEKDFETIHHIENSLKAKELYTKDKDYVVQNGQIIIVDQHTGRLLPSVRWGEGLHQAVEAKEGLEIQPESKTVATISYQNYFRLYDKLAGMTGTAETEASEFFKIYNLDVVVIPTFKPIARKDKPDIVYKTEAAKFRAMARDIAERNKKGQPVLVGTTSVERSQLLSNFLKRLKIPHEILNAKQHDKEALVIAQAGRKGSVTVSTNMAGRGVDIILGGDPFDKSDYDEVIDLGGLYVIGSERHESRRIDLQLRGRSGRQGDPGESRFYLSTQDELLRIFGGERIESIMGRLGVDENTPIESSIISRSIENAQKKVEGMNFDRRRTVVDYDDVMNVQREAIYSMRRYILFTKDSYEDFEIWMMEKLGKSSDSEFMEVWERKKKKYGEEVWKEVIRRVTLEVIDVLWVDHIDFMDDLRTGVGLRGYGQVDPLVEYRREGRERFETLVAEIWANVADRVEKVEVEVMRKTQTQQTETEVELDTQEVNLGVSDEVQEKNFIENSGEANKLLGQLKSNKIGRNDPCPCGSGKKYKHCHGRKS